MEADKLHRLYLNNEINYSNLNIISIEELLFIKALSNKNTLYINFNYHINRKPKFSTFESLKPFKEVYDLCIKLLEKGFNITIFTIPCMDYVNGELCFNHYNLQMKISF